MGPTPLSFERIVVVGPRAGRAKAGGWSSIYFKVLGSREKKLERVTVARPFFFSQFFVLARKASPACVVAEKATIRLPHTRLGELGASLMTSFTILSMLLGLSVDDHTACCLHASREAFRASSKFVGRLSRARRRSARRSEQLLDCGSHSAMGTNIRAGVRSHGTSRGESRSLFCPPY